MPDLASEEAALGRWPRRLLHVPSLTSYEWQAGNRYGNAVAPEYNAITYTWGRWRLKDEPSYERPEITALPITGIAWPIPRVKPEHFTPEQLQRVLRNAASFRPNHIDFRRRKSVDFVWLDVACIDQRASEPRSAAEIGRQAAIFREAQNVCVWFTTLEKEIIARTVTSLVDFSESMALHGSRNETAIVEDVLRFLSDPWFSSLWTLQEAFLRVDAFILDKEGELVEYPACTERWGNPALLDVLDSACRWSAISTEERSVWSAQGLYSRVSQLVEERGFKALASFNAMSTYVAALRRMTTEPEDRIYGIQQIFEFRLGKSALDAKPGHNYSLAELEDQLGEALIIRYPILSQFHVFTKQTSPGKRWRMNSSSVIPPGAGDQGYPLWESAEVDQPRCSFSIEHSAHTKFVQWSGPITPLCELIKTCKSVIENFEICERLGADNMMFIYLDAAEELAGSPECQVLDYHLPQTPRQKQLREWMIGQFRQEELQVLLLGPSSTKSCSYKLGVVMLHREHGEWARLGICSWETITDFDLPLSDKLLPKLEFLVGDGLGWKRGEGIYGYL